MKKNIVLVGITLLLLFFLGIGVSYSMWNMTNTQEKNNVIASSECFDVSITSQENSINLQNTYPISNEKGKKLTPFTFTVTNMCETAASYSINLESLKGSTLSSEFLDIMLNNGEIKKLNTYSSAKKVNSSSIESRELETGILGNKESRDYSLRLWIDYDTTMEDLNNETKTFKSKIVVVGKPINYTGDTVFNFDYTGGEQTFTAPVSGTYKLETWGAQGGNSFNDTYQGGYGAYSVGNVSIKKVQILFINIGGQGASACLQSICSGGYNGGGNSGAYMDDNRNWNGGGGGATHIASKSGILSTLEKFKSSIYIVSGAGGGATNRPNDGLIGGDGGGNVGNSSLNDVSYSYQGSGGTQQTGGKNYDSGVIYSNSIDGSFGKGGTYLNTAENYNSSGGGGGWYGGGFAGGGGSGYIGNPLLANKVMYCYNCEESTEESTKTISTTCSEETPTNYCSKKGNGYARITLISIEE